MNYSYLLFIFGLASLSPLACAQSASSESISLRDALEAVLEANPRLDSFPFREEALRGQRDTAALTPPLRVTGGAEEFLGSGALQDFSATEINIGLSQVLEMGDKREARIAVLDQHLGLLEAEQRVVELDLLGETTQRFIDVSAAQEYYALQQQATILARQTIELLEPLLQAGRVPRLELDRAEAARIRAEAAEAMAQARLESAKIRLASMWGEIDPNFDTVDANLLVVGEAGSLSRLLAQLENNPEIEIYATEARLREAELQQALSRRQADIEWSAGLRHLQELGDTGFTVGVSIPLFSRARAGGAIREARANRNEVEARRAVLLNRMRGEISSLHQELLQTIAEVNLLDSEVLPRLQTVLEQSRSAYESGTYSYLELITAQQEYLDAELALINSAANAHRLRAEIETLSGQALTAQ